MASVKLSFVADGITTDAAKKYKALFMTVLETIAKREALEFHVSIMLTDAVTIRTLNKQFRAVDRITDVLSFPAAPFEGRLVDHIIAGGFVERVETMLDLGDIAICFSCASNQAQEIGHSIDRELAFLVVHGVLHLLGYDHETQEDEDEMTDAQREIMDVIAESDMR